MFTGPGAGRSMACFECHKEAICLELKKHWADADRKDQGQQGLRLRMQIRVLVKENKWHDFSSF